MLLSDSIKTRLHNQHETVSALIMGLGEERLKRRPHSGKWSPFENIAHLAAYQPVFRSRVDRIVKEEEPVFERYVAEQDPGFPAYLEKNTEALIRILRQDRSAIVDTLAGMDARTLGRIGVHPRYGRLDLTGWTEFFLLHEAHHLYTLFALTCDLRNPGRY